MTQSKDSTPIYPLRFKKPLLIALMVFGSRTIVLLSGFVHYNKTSSTMCIKWSLKANGDGARNRLIQATHPVVESKKNVIPAARQILRKEPE